MSAIVLTDMRLLPPFPVNVRRALAIALGGEQQCAAEGAATLSPRRCVRRAAGGYCASDDRRSADVDCAGGDRCAVGGWAARCAGTAVLDVVERC
jgi:hypothetical protein